MERVQTARADLSQRSIFGTDSEVAIRIVEVRRTDASWGCVSEQFTIGAKREILERRVQETDIAKALAGERIVDVHRTASDGVHHDVV